MFKSILALTMSAALLAGCAEKGKESPREDIAAAVYLNQGSPKLTVMTMINNRTGAGAHTSLLVESTQTVLFDPAGSFQHELVPERGDVLYGMSPDWVDWYKSAHARETFHVVSQEFLVTPAQAARALQLVEANGAVPSAFCASATSRLLKQIPGFESIKPGFYPEKLMEQVAQLPGVKTSKHFEDDQGNVRDGVAALSE